MGYRIIPNSEKLNPQSPKGHVHHHFFKILVEFLFAFNVGEFGQMLREIDVMVRRLEQIGRKRTWLREVWFYF